MDDTVSMNSSSGAVFSAGFAEESGKPSGGRATANGQQKAGGQNAANAQQQQVGQANGDGGPDSEGAALLKPSPPKPVLSFRERFLPFQPIPWWLMMILIVAFFTDLRWRFHESPCAVLGISDPVTSGSIKKAFRNVSLCTHPDRLRAKLRRAPTAAEEVAGQTLFNRHTQARDELVKFLDLKQRRREIRKERRNKRRRKQGLPPLEADEEEEAPIEAKCSDLDAGLNWRQFFQELASIEAVSEIGAALYEFMYQLITFQQGFLTTVAISFWFIFLYRMIKELYRWSLSAGFGLPLYVVGAIISRPLPTLIRFFSLPFLRVMVFWEELRGGTSEEHALLSPREADQDKKDEAAPVKASSRHVAAATDKTETHLRKRRVDKKKKEKDAEVAEKLLEGPADEEEDGDKQLPPAIEMVPQHQRAVVEGQNPAAGAPRGGATTTTLPGQPSTEDAMVSRAHLGVLEILRLRSDTPNKARMQVAAATQFDLLLPLTKPIIPLLMLVCTGQVWSGLLSSIFVSQFLRSFVPQMNYETHHLLCFAFGFLHTLLGLDVGQVEAHADKENAVLLLQWTWGLKDMVSICNMIMFGAFVASLSRNGNEPQFCNSFASGMGMRLLTTFDFFSQIPFQENVIAYYEQLQADLGVKMQSVDEVLTNARPDIGDCAGGFFRHAAAGDESLALYLSYFAKMFLVILPGLNAVQWFSRAVSGAKGMHGKNVRRRKRLMRVLTRMVLGAAAVLQCVLLLFVFNLNAANGALLNLWLAFLLGAVFESYLACEEIRGAFRQFVTAVVFIFI
ncbi:unnamed protein product [Amoebophrya sp. A25]|nr:unnamed protein product [Amoebophrya sp. A25]|eukprot:GSA25T00020841001.1